MAYRWRVAAVITTLSLQLTYVVVRAHDVLIKTTVLKSDPTHIEFKNSMYRYTGLQAAPGHFGTHSAEIDTPTEFEQPRPRLPNPTLNANNNTSMPSLPVKLLPISPNKLPYICISLPLHNLQHCHRTRLRTLNPIPYSLLPIVGYIRNYVPGTKSPDLEAIGLKLVVLVRRQHVQRCFTHAVPGVPDTGVLMAVV